MGHAWVLHLATAAKGGGGWVAIKTWLNCGALLTPPKCKQALTVLYPYNSSCSVIDGVVALDDTSALQFSIMCGLHLQDQNALT